MHPRVVTRLSKPLVMLLINLLIQCELEGKWPRAVALVLIALLPKTDGGFRPIGLLPFLPRLWMRVRKKLATDWECRNERGYLYAGRRKGANVAAWKQAVEAYHEDMVAGCETRCVSLQGGDGWEGDWCAREGYGDLILYGHDWSTQQAMSTRLDT